MNVLNALAEATRAHDTANGDTPRAWGQARADHFVSILTTAGDIPERYDEVVASGHSRTTCHARGQRVASSGNDHSPAATLTRDGYGPFDADLARELTADGTWQRWIAEDTGRITDLGRTSYRPSQALRDLILANHPTCATPGCRCRGELTQIDHIDGWADGGATNLANLQPLCRRHHQEKTRGDLTAQALPDGRVAYRTRHGLRLTSEHAHTDQVISLLDREIDQPDEPPF